MSSGNVNGKPNPSSASPWVASDGAGVGIRPLSSEGFSALLTPPNCLLAPTALARLLAKTSQVFGLIGCCGRLG